MARHHKYIDPKTCVYLKECTAWVHGCKSFCYKKTEETVVTSSKCVTCKWRELVEVEGKKVWYCTALKKSTSDKQESCKNYEACDPSKPV